MMTAFGSGAPLEISGVSRKELQRQSISGSNAALVLAEIVYPPGLEAPPHVHPVGGLVYILEGVAESAYGDEPAHRLEAGDSAEDKAGVTHRVFRNCDPEKPLRFLTFYRIEPGQEYATPV